MSDDLADTVLRVLSQAGIAVSPGGIAANVDELADASTSTDAVADALDDLEAENYVRALDDTDYYRITEHGRDYVKSEFGEDVFGYID